MLNTRGFGYLFTVKVPALNAGVSQKIGLSGEIKESLGFVNSLYILNESAEDFEFYLDYDTTKMIKVKAGQSVALNGTRFQELIQKNVSATNSSADEVTVTVQKSIQDLERLEINGFSK